MTAVSDPRPSAGAVRPDAARARRRSASGRGRGRGRRGRSYDDDGCSPRATGATWSTGYRYWTLEAIVADLDTRRHDFHVAIENWQHDFNIGTIVRTANAFLAREVHIVGKRRWNRRGAMVTDRYQHVRHHESVADLRGYLHERGVALMGVDNLPGSERLETLGDAPLGVLPVRPGGAGSVRARARRPATGPSRSRSSARPARSTPRRPRRSRCTPGCATHADLDRAWRG